MMAAILQVRNLRGQGVKAPAQDPTAGVGWRSPWNPRGSDQLSSATYPLPFPTPHLGRGGGEEAVPPSPSRDD